MTLSRATEISASGLAAQRQRIEVLVSNLVNAHTTRAEGNEPYRRKDVLFAAAEPQSSFGKELNAAMIGVNAVEVTGVIADRADPVRRYEPGHPHADKDGYVLYPNINPMEEMVNIMSASRSYEANLQAINAVKEMKAKTLELLR